MGVHQRYRLGPERIIEDAEHLRFGRAEIIDCVNKSESGVQRPEGGENLVRFGLSASEVPLINREHFADSHLVIKGAVPLKEFVPRIGQ